MRRRPSSLALIDSDPPTADDYLTALKTIWPAKRDRSRVLAMLSFQIRQGGQVTSAELARHFGYTNLVTANGFYGRFAHEVADELRLKKTGGTEWWFTISTGDRSKANGAFAWTLRKPFERALARFHATSRLRPSHETTDVSVAPLDRLDREFVRRLVRDRQAKFRRTIMAAYGGRCCLTECGVEVCLEAAHLDRFAESGNNQVTNGILLRADLHRLLDTHLLTLSSRQGSIVVRIHPSVADPIYRAIDGRPLRVPADRTHHPKLALLSRVS